MPIWAWLIPVSSFALFLVAMTVGVGPWLVALCGAALIGAVLVAVHHAEVVAHRVGEPLGTLVLALAMYVETRRKPAPRETEWSNAHA